MHFDWNRNINNGYVILHRTENFSFTKRCNGKHQPISILVFIGKYLEKPTCQVHPCYDLYAMASGAAPSNSTAPQIQFMGNSAVAEAEAALQSLGYKPAEAQKLINAVKADYTEASDIIRAALKSMNR